MTNFLTGAETGLIGGDRRAERSETAMAYGEQQRGTRSNEGKVRRLKSPVISARVDLDLERRRRREGEAKRREREREGTVRCTTRARNKGGS